MVERITLNKVASFNSGNPVELEFNERVSMIYGLNGTGKSTIARYLNVPSQEDFKHCTIKKNQEAETIVYDRDFIEQNFDLDEIPGVFSLGKEDVLGKKIIKNNENRIANIDIELRRKIESRDQFLDELTVDKNETHEVVYDIVKGFKKGQLDFCLDGYKGNKSKYYNALLTHDYNPSLDYDFSSLEAEIKEIDGEDVKKKDELELIGSEEITQIENDEVFKQRILASGSSYLSEMINKLGNSDWVSLGRDIIESSTYEESGKEQCPFCQQKLPSNFENELRTLFDRTYEDKKTHLQSLLENYRREIELINKQFEKEKYQDDLLLSETDFKTIKKDFLIALDRNVEIIEKKLENLSEIYEITETNDSFDKVNSVISDANEKIRQHNEKLENPKKVKTSVNNKFWKLARNKSESLIKNFKKRKEEKQKKINQAEAYIEKAREIKKKLEVEIERRKKKSSGIGQSVHRINQTAKSLGVIGFEIIEVEDESNKYRVVRNKEESQEGVFKTLSEGEKTLITFLYFLEMIKGSLESATAVNLPNRVIVIDDPISSLSHNYVYEVASLIDFQIIRKAYGQVIVLTHNLFFLHELLHQMRSKDKCTLYRIIKDTSTYVKEMGPNEIRNDYEGYWAAFKDIKETKKYLLAPIVMRNILENYFSFVRKREDLNNAIYELEGEHKEYKPFLRFINKEAHSDMNTLQDMGQIDPKRFFQIFKKIFEKTDFLDHYYTMSGEKPE